MHVSLYELRTQFLQLHKHEINIASTVYTTNWKYHLSNTYTSYEALPLHYTGIITGATLPL